MQSTLKGKNILIGITAGIAAYKIPLFIRLLKNAGANVKVIATPAAFDFVTPLVLATVSQNPVLSNMFDRVTGKWENHVELGEWADLFIIAPLTANSLADMASGKAENLLLTTYLSARCKVVGAPAMDLEMWEHPTVKRNLDIVINDGLHIIQPQYGALASGLVGFGRLPEPEQLFNEVNNLMSDKLLLNKKILITAGPTFEKIDPVRFLGNNSSGKMGFALAQVAAQMGAEVTLIHGPVKLPTPFGIKEAIAVQTAADMLEVTLKHFTHAHITIMAAAVADFTPIFYSEKKIKKSENQTPEIKLTKTTDILKKLGAIKLPNQKLIGFALESDNEIYYAKEKLLSKNADMIVLNSLNNKGAGFNYDTNQVILIGHNFEEHIPLASKYEIAQTIVNKIVTLE